MTSSSLSRRLFQSIISNEPYYSPGCLRIHTRTRKYRVPVLSGSDRLRRNIFGFSLGSTSKAFEGSTRSRGNIESAQGVLVDLIRGRRAQSRLPPNEKVIDAFKFLFAQETGPQRSITKNEVFLAQEVFQFLDEKNLIAGGENSSSLTEQDLKRCLVNLSVSNIQDRQRSDIIGLAGSIFSALEKTSNISGGHVVQERSVNIQKQALAAYIMVLAKTSSAQQALKLLKQNIQSPEFQGQQIWIPVLQGLASEGDIQGFWESLKSMQSFTSPLDPLTHEYLTVFFARKNDTENTKKIYHWPLSGSNVPTTACLIEIAEFCIRNKEDELGSNSIQALRTRTDNGDIAPVLLLWASHQKADNSSLRSTIDDLARSGVTNPVTMATVNRLVRFAYAQHNLEAVADYISLANSLHLRPDATTYAIELRYHLQQGDLIAAARTFEQMSVEENSTDPSEVQTLNAFAASLAFSDGEHYELLMRVVDRILETGADLDAEAVAGLSHVLLQRQDLDEATRLLRYRVDSYPLGDRAKVAAVFRTYIVNTSVPAQQAFNAYELFRHAFPETRVEARLPLMHSFFDRHRPDLACLVFGHMRQQEDLQVRPTIEAYAQCFEGIARCKDVDGLQMIYNMLKLDLEVEQSTRIRNGLMEAYTACQMPFTAIIDHFWKILDSREGPTLSSFALALRACETWIPQGSLEARRIIALMQTWNLIITKEIYHCYIGAMAGQSEFENTVDLIQEMYNDIGEKPDAITIGTFYNAIPWQYRKNEVEAWAKRTYPDLWEELVSYGEEIDEEWEIRYFKIDRSIDIEDEPLFGEGEYNPRLAWRPTEALESPA